VTVVNARDSVLEEVTSSLLFAEQLLGLEGLRERTVNLAEVRHLRVALVSDDEIKSGVDSQNSSSSNGLFTRLVRPDTEQLRLVLGTDKNGDSLVLVANPEDEILEAWQEAQVFIGFLSAMSFFILISVFAVIGRALRPVDEILLTIAEIEKGDYLKRLRSFNLPEFSNIANGINHLSDKLSQSKEENRQLNMQALDVQERERHFLARELHDEMGQSLSAIKALIAAAQHESKEQIKSLVQVGDICDHLFGVIRNRMAQLTPPLLNEFGLRVSLDELIDKWQGKALVTFNMEEGVEQLVEDNAIHYYRIIQESLTNTLKHAQANHIWIELRKEVWNDKAVLRLFIEDDGIGFDLGNISQSGLLGIKERVESLRGTLLLKTKPSVQLIAIFPIGVCDE
jgi:two-component system sensor histidine kinase UhpB